MLGDTRNLPPRPFPKSGRAQDAFWALGDRGRWAMARLLAKERALTVAEAGRLLGVRALTASRYLQALWKAGVATRETPVDDTRRREFRLTELGESLVQIGLLADG